MEERFEKFTFAIFEIEKSWHRITSEEMAKYDLKGSHSLYLLTLLKYKKGLPASKLCEICGKDKADVSRMTKILIDKGLAVKEGNNDKKYGGSYILTPLGIKAAKKVKEKVRKAVDAASVDLSDDNRANLYDSLSIISRNLKTILKEGIK